MNEPSTVSYAVDGIAPSRVERPSSVEELSKVVRDLHGAGEAAIAWGGGTRIHVGNRPERYDVAVDVTGLDRIVEYEPADLTVVVQAGIRLAGLQAELAKSGQRLAFDPPSPLRATIGGSLASNAVGPLRTGFGGVRDLTIGMKVVEADGAVTKSGGRVVKNVQGFDLVRLHIGAFGTLGIIAEAAFKLTPAPAQAMTVAAWFDSLDSAREAATQIFNGAVAPEALTLLAGSRASGFADEASANAGLEAAARYLLLARLAGGPAAARRQVDDVTATVGAAMANGFEVLEDADEDAVWELCEAGETDLPVVSARATLKPLAAFEFVSRLEDATGLGPLTLDATLHVGTGTVIVNWSSGEDTSPADVRAAIEASFQQARDCGGLAIIERCPLDAKSDIDVWGELGPTLEIMRRMKHQFDPDRTLSPGRFAGGI